MKPALLAVVLLMLSLSPSFGQDPVLEFLGNIRAQTNAAVQPRASTRVETLKPDNSFARNNPDYAERSGAFYEKEYLEKALEQMAAVVQLTDEQKSAARRTLRIFISDWLESYVRGDGHMSSENLERCLTAMDEKFKGELSQPGYEVYLTWRKDETGGSNALAFLMNPRFAIPQTPAQAADLTQAGQTGKIQLPPLGFHTIDFSKDFWASLTEDSKLTGKVAGVLPYEQIKRMVILRCNLHVPDGDYLETFIHGWLTEAAEFHPGPLPENATQDLRSPLLTVLFENAKGEHGLLTMYSDVAVLEINGRYGLVLKNTKGL
jgi:hypothetical protein